MIHAPQNSPERYLRVEDQLCDLKIPDNQQANIQALIEYEAQFDRMKRGWEQRAECMECYSNEVDRRGYLLFCDGKFVGSNNLRAMPRLIKIGREWYPDGVMLLHGMGSKVDFDMINKVGELASDHPENWVPRAGGKRTQDVDGLKLKIEGLEDPS